MASADTAAAAAAVAPRGVVGVGERRAAGGGRVQPPLNASTGSSGSTPARLVQQLTRRQIEVMRRAPPPRTPPSIPLPQARGTLATAAARSGGGRHSTFSTPRRVRLLSDLDRQMRRARSPRSSFLRHFKAPLGGSPDSARSVSTAPSPATQALMDGAVHVCRLTLPLSRQQSLPSLLGDFSFSQENLESLFRQPTEISLLAESTALHSIAEATSGAAAIADGGADGGDAMAPPSDRMVSFFQSLPLAPLQPPPPLPPRTAPVAGTTGVGGTRGPKQEALPALSRQTTSLLSSRSVTTVPSARAPGAVPATRSQLTSRGQGFESRSGCRGNSARNLARLGRPIAHYAYIADPGEVAVAVQKQKEAAAAVDIQRIFRGYVARNVYRKLLGDEREKMEEKQRAAMEIQRAYRSHVHRKRVIEKRPYNPKLVQWGHHYRVHLATRQQQRRVKLDQRSDELCSNFHSAHSRLSVIGPHVNIYEIYHPKKTGPTKRELNAAAIVIQRHVRGWVVRRRFEKLQRKAAWYGSTFPRLVREYKALLIKIQKQHGVEHPQTPFSTRDMNDYIDIRRRYESVFEKKAFGGELELGDIDSYFKECDLYPSQAEISKSMETVFGKGHSAARQGRGLKKHEILDMLFYIYTPRATGLQNTRQSTWLNPIIDGVEARRLLGSEYVEEAPLEVCAQLVIASMRERHEKDRAAERARKDREAAELRERLGIPHPRDSDEEEEEKEKMRRRMKVRRVTLTEPATKDGARRSSVTDNSNNNNNNNNKLEERRLSKEGKVENAAEKGQSDKAAAAEKGKTEKSVENGKK